MQNHFAIRDFVDYWRVRKSFQTAPTGNCKFPATISYQSKKLVVDIETIVTIIRNGYEDGKISLEERGTLDSAIYHLDFSPDFQTYQYDAKDYSLNITGSSPKMGGAYSVKILPSNT